MIFVALVLTGTIFIVFSIYFLLSSYLLLGKDVAYDYLAYPNKIDEYFQNLKSHYLNLGQSEEDAVKNANTDFENYFIAAFIRTSTKNMSINDDRSTNLYRCKQKILYSVITLLIAFIPYLVNFYLKEEKIPKVQIVNSTQQLKKN